MSFRDLVLGTRSIRRFDSSRAVTMQELRDLVDLARLTASGANLQPLKYVLVTEPGMRARVFECLAWAAYLRDWKGPAENERPTGYVVMLQDTSITSARHGDHGIAAQTMMLGAAEKGLGGCIVGSVNKKDLAGILDLSDDLEVILVLALGKPGEMVILEPVGPDGDIKYRRDENGVHHVPKRSLDEVIVAEH